MYCICGYFEISVVTVMYLAISVNHVLSALCLTITIKVVSITVHLTHYLHPKTQSAAVHILCITNCTHLVFCSVNNQLSGKKVLASSFSSSSPDSLALSPESVVEIVTLVKIGGPSRPGRDTNGYRGLGTKGGGGGAGGVGLNMLERSVTPAA